MPQTQTQADEEQAADWHEPQSSSDFKKSPAFNYFENEEEANAWEESSNFFGCAPDSFIQELAGPTKQEAAKPKR